MTSGSAADYRFDGFELQVLERRLLSGGEAVPVGPRAFDLLVLLVERAGRLVSKDELFALLWPKVVVEDSALQVQISSLRRIIGAKTIATVSGHGYRFVADVSRVEAPDRAPGSKPRHNLPPATSSFIGRKLEIEQLRSSLQRRRLVTLTGAGGCGKTRLAIQVASQVLDRYPDGVFMAELAALADPALVPHAVIAAFGLKDSGSGALRTLVAHLAPRHPLLVLDNAEHLKGACSELVDALLRDCPGIGILVTSREPLGVAGELTHRVPSMSLPDLKQPVTVESLLGSESARLFIDRARSLQPQFEPTDQNARVLALVCTHLDGIPLALELAAGRMRTMSVEDIGQRLHQRFSLLAGGTHATLPRHRTLRSLIDWSYDLLGEAEQALLCRLSVFAGGCTAAAAEQVCSPASGDSMAVRPVLASLADKNLLVVDEHDGATRHRMLETVRQYAEARLAEQGDAADWKRRHLAHFAALADEAGRHSSGPEQGRWFDRLDAEMDNLRTALSTACASDDTLPAGLQMANDLARFWMVRGHLTEGRAHFSSLLAAPTVAAHPVLRAGALNRSGSLASAQGDNAAARARLEQALALYREIGDARQIASVLNNLGTSFRHMGDRQRAIALYEESVSILRGLSNKEGLARSLHNLADLWQSMGALDAGRAALEEAYRLAEDVGNRHSASMSLRALGLCAALQGHHDEARRTLVQALRIEQEIGAPASMAYSLEGLAQIAAATGQFDRAARLWGAADALRSSVGAMLPRDEQDELLGRIAEARAALADDTVFDAAWHAGAAMTPETIVRCAAGPDGSAGLS